LNAAVVPNSPSVTGSQEFCGSGTVGMLTGSAGSGEELLWYASSTGGVALSSSTALVTGTYYGSSRDLTTGCESSTRSAVSVTIKATPVFSLGTVSQVSSCGGSDGSIEFTGLSNNTSYELTYKKEGLMASMSVLSTGAGSVVMSGLPVGSYSDFSISLSGCSSTVLTGPVVITEPTPAVLVLDSSNDPTTCSGNDGSIVLSGLEATMPYGVSYKKDGVQVNSNLLSDGSGKISLINLSSASYTDIKVVKDNCESNMVSSVILSDPTAPTLALSSVNDPATCSGQGSIEFTGLSASTSYTFNFTQNGTVLSRTVSSDASGKLLVSNLDAGLYENMSVSLGGCVSNTIARAVINPPVISLGSVTDSSTCSSGGSIEILGLVVNEPYRL
jgi:hypothetical protein